MAELLVVLGTLAVGVVLLVVLVLAVRRPVRRFARARAGLTHEVRTGVAQLRALAYVREDHHPHGVDSP